MERYNRQTILPQIGVEGQQKLLDSSVVVIGCGALGTHTLDSLARAGVGNITAVDRDFVELHNLHRLAILDEEDVGRPKAEALKEKLDEVNSEIEICAQVKDVNPTNVEKLIQDSDLVLDCTDNLITRYLINDGCVKQGIPWIYAAVIATYGMTMNIFPGKGPCFRCLFPERPAPGTMPTCDTAGILNTIPQAISALQVTEAYKILIGDSDVTTELKSLDILMGEMGKNHVEKDEDCPCCGQRDFQFLDAKLGEKFTSLCGRNAIQVNPLRSERIDLKALSEKLSKLGEVEYNQSLLRFHAGENELNIFKDGRAIIKGTEDEEKAKILYSQYIGA